MDTVLDVHSLPPGQARMLRAIAEYWLDNGHGPSYRDLGRRLGIASPNGVVYHLRRLAVKGFLTGYTPRQFRARCFRPRGLPTVQSAGPDRVRLYVAGLPLDLTAAEARLLAAELLRAAGPA